MSRAGETSLKKSLKKSLKSVTIDESDTPQLKEGHRYFFIKTSNPKKRFVGIYNGKNLGLHHFVSLKTYKLEDGIEKKLDKEPIIKIIGNGNINKYKFFKLNFEFEGLPDDMNKYISEYVGGANKRQTKRRDNKSKRRDNKSKRCDNRK
jgi:hypothetical protein